jgi:hypothetical protein
MTVTSKVVGVKFLAAALVLTLFGLVAFDDQAAAQPGKKAEYKRFHPHLHKAMKNLKGAHKQLEEASHHYGGHRVKALRAVDVAMREVRLALEYREDFKK